MVEAFSDDSRTCSRHQPPALLGGCSGSVVQFLMHSVCVCSALAAERHAAQQLQGRRGRGMTHPELERQLEQQRRRAEADKAASLQSLKDLFQRCSYTPYKTSEHFCFSMDVVAYSLLRVH